jgi:hypothetical protein
MTAEDRNKRMKWGTDVPRWWIHDFNMSHRDQAGQQPKPRPKSQPTPEGSADSDSTSIASAFPSPSPPSPSSPSSAPHEIPVIRNARGAPTPTGERLADSANVEAYRHHLFTQQARWLQERRQAASSGSSRNDPYQQRERKRLNRIARRRWVEDSTKQLNRDLRVVQVVFALLIILAGLVAGGLPGLLVGAAAALLLQL